MKNLRKLLTAALAATMLAGAVSVSTPAAAWHSWGWGPGSYWGYGGAWRRPGYWGYGAGLATGLALGASSYPYGYGYWGSASPGYYGYSGYGGYSGCGCGW